MATRRLTTAALRGAGERAVASTAPRSHVLRSSFSTASPSLRCLVSPARPRSLRSIAPRRAQYSTDMPQSRFWTFEQINVARATTEAAATPSAAPRVTLIDVREPDELHKTGRIPGALNIPMMTHPDSFHISADDFRDRFGFERPGDDDQVVFYCKAGVRSRAAAEIAMKAGWKNVGEYPGSWLDWCKNGGDVQMGMKVRKGDKGGEGKA
ncbi:Rhodanese-like protein [Annulohypoxylon maeteangense]|uniref:Rhodanese-like protein n=1 Tax=Annulohypoxylon maeteangense TaxID=1927788 RepID=UPI0020072437|nr:Rhodanese-like protein [Annulohypoxylon maeteangense]KAI0888682.1 Rhodanese-like protein [Annulohypoxylon maeteangense]